MAHYLSQSCDELLAVLRTRPHLDEDTLQEVDLNGLSATGLCVSRSTLRNTSLVQAEIPASQWLESALQGISLRKSNLEGAILEESHFAGSDLIEVNLQGAKNLWTSAQAPRMRPLNRSTSFVRKLPVLRQDIKVQHRFGGVLGLRFESPNRSR